MTEPDLRVLLSVMRDLALLGLPLSDDDRQVSPTGRALYQALRQIAGARIGGSRGACRHRPRRQESWTRRGCASSATPTPAS
jgi:hypothetical protein